MKSWENNDDDNGILYVHLAKSQDMQFFFFNVNDNDNEPREIDIRLFARLFRYIIQLFHNYYNSRQHKHTTLCHQIISYTNAKMYILHSAPLFVITLWRKKKIRINKDFIKYTFRAWKTFKNSRSIQCSHRVWEVKYTCTFEIKNLNSKCNCAMHSLIIYKLYKAREGKETSRRYA